MKLSNVHKQPSIRGLNGIRGLVGCQIQKPCAVIRAIDNACSTHWILDLCRPPDDQITALLEGELSTGLPASPN